MSKKARVKGKGADIFFSEDVSREANNVLAPRDAQGKVTTKTLVSFSDTELIKATFYFRKSQIDALEKAVFVLRQEHSIKTNKSELMRIALESLIKEFSENQKESALFTRLVG